MKYWSVIFVFFYGLLIAALIPVLNFLDTGLKGNFLKEYTENWFWIVLLIIIVVEVLLLVVPVKIVSSRPISKRSLLIPVITGSLLFAFLVLVLIFALGAVVQGDRFLSFLDSEGFVLIALLLLLWLFWFFVFFKMQAKHLPETFVKRQLSLLIKGSVLELLIALPSHLLVRQKDECCASGFTLLGIVTGISLMLLSFGPGIFFLYAERINKKKSQHSTQL